MFVRESKASGTVQSEDQEVEDREEFASARLWISLGWGQAVGIMEGWEM